MPKFWTVSRYLVQFLGDPVALQAYLPEEATPAKLRKGWFVPLGKSSCSQTSETHNASTSQIPEVSDCLPIPETSSAHDVFKNSDEYQIEIDQILTDDVKTSKPFELFEISSTKL